MAHLLTNLLSALVGFLIALLLQQRGFRIWEAQERWKFKADVYAKALSCLVRMGAPFEVAADKGTWPDGDNMKHVLDASRELMEPAVRAELWLPEAAVQPLKSQGERLLALRQKFDKSPKENVSLEVCELIRKDIDALVAIARQDLRLSLTPPPRWKCLWSRTKENPPSA